MFHVSGKVGPQSANTAKSVLCCGKSHCEEAVSNQKWQHKHFLFKVILQKALFSEKSTHMAPIMLKEHCCIHLLALVLGEEVLQMVFRFKIFSSAFPFCKTSLKSQESDRQWQGNSVCQGDVRAVCEDEDAVSGCTCCSGVTQEAKHTKNALAWWKSQWAKSSCNFQFKGWGRALEKLREGSALVPKAASIPFTLFTVGALDLSAPSHLGPLLALSWCS